MQSAIAEKHTFKARNPSTLYTVSWEGKLGQQQETTTHSVWNKIDSETQLELKLQL